jgi:hypothetical protein
MMLEGKSYLVPCSLLSSKTETQWAYLAHEVHGGKRLAPEDCEVEDLDEADGGGKCSKPPSPQSHTWLQPPCLRLQRAAGHWEQPHEFNRS